MYSICIGKDHRQSAFHVHTNICGYDITNRNSRDAYKKAFKEQVGSVHALYTSTLQAPTPMPFLCRNIWSEDETKKLKIT